MRQDGGPRALARRADKDPRHLAKVRRLPCEVCGRPGPNDAHHRTGGGMGTKMPDTATIPLCSQHHRDFHDLTGPFKGWTKERLREWQIRAVMKTLERLGI